VFPLHYCILIIHYLMTSTQPLHSMSRNNGQGGRSQSVTSERRSIQTDSFFWRFLLLFRTSTFAAPATVHQVQREDHNRDSLNPCTSSFRAVIIFSVIMYACNPAKNGCRYRCLKMTKMTRMCEMVIQMGEM
jgi:hypothetical protein